MKLADRMAFLGGDGMGNMLQQVVQLKAAGKKVIPLHAGEPDFDTPGLIVESAIQALRNGETHYVPAAGTAALRKAIAEHISESRHVDVAPDQVIVAPGAKPMIYFAILALCGPGDEVLCPNPAYPFYASISNFVGAKAVSMPLTMDTGFRFNAELLAQLVTDRTRLIVLNSPSNPTGSILQRSDLEAVADIAQRYDAFILSDEIYSRIVYDIEKFESIVSLPGMTERTVLVDGHSKTYAMTGWRLGYGVMPRALAAQITKIALNTISCSATFTQTAGAQAITGPQDDVTRMVARFRQRRDRIVDGLNSIPGVRCLRPDGAFYAFAKIEATDMPSQALSEYLLSHAGVATYPGSAFGEYGEGFLRLSFACSESDIDEGLVRIREALAKL